MQSGQVYMNASRSGSVIHSVGLSGQSHRPPALPLPSTGAATSPAAAASAASSSRRRSTNDGSLRVLTP